MSQWEGFIKPENDFFKVPNNFIEALALIDNMAELKVILYVMRHTWGFQEFEEMKRIAADEFAHGRKSKGQSRMDNGTGLSERSVRMGATKAIEHGFLECDIDDSDRGRIKKSYRLKLKQTSESDPVQPHHNSKTDRQSRIQELATMPYSDYLQTPEWAAKRKKALRFAGFRCQLCNSNENLNVHHRTYKRRGYERLSDLTVLCEDCHATFHKNGELDL